MWWILLTPEQNSLQKRERRMEPMSLPKDRMQEKDAVAEGLTPRQGQGIWMTLVLKPEIESEPCFHDHISDGACSV